MGSYVAILIGFVIGAVILAGVLHSFDLPAQAWRAWTEKRGKNRNRDRQVQ